jgi:hypothetical protein
MKNKIAIIIVLATATLSASAQDNIKPLQMTIKATAEIQNQLVDNGTTKSVAAPLKFSVTTKSLMAMLAQDEFSDGNYPSATFPSGAKLMFMADETDFSNSTFQVVDKEGLELVDVTDELRLEINVDGIPVTSGEINISTAVLTGKENLSYIAKLSFDNTGSNTPGTLYGFYLQGIVEDVTSDTVPKNGSYTEKENSKMADGAGPGESVGAGKTSPMIISGSLSFSGTKVFSVQ